MMSWIAWSWNKHRDADVPVGKRGKRGPRTWFMWDTVRCVTARMLASLHHSFWHAFSLLWVNERGKAHLNAESPLISIPLVEMSNKTGSERESFETTEPLVSVTSSSQGHVFFPCWLPCDILINTLMEELSLVSSTLTAWPVCFFCFLFFWFFFARGASFESEEKSPRQDKTKSNDFELTDSDADWLFGNRIAVKFQWRCANWAMISYWNYSNFHIACTCCDWRTWNIHFMRHLKNK